MSGQQPTSTTDFLNSLRSDYSPHQAAGRLAAQVALWRADHDAAPPAWLSTLSLDLPSSVAAEHRAWLDKADESQILDHVSALVEVASAEGVGAHLSGRSLDLVAEVALLTTRREVNLDYIYDPTAGVGSTLLRTWAASKGVAGVIGQEINHEIANLARINLYMHGASAELAVGDSLVEDLHSAHSVGLAVSQPPWGLRWESQAKAVRSQAVFAPALPPRSDSQWLFAMRMVEKFHAPSSGGGRGVIFLSASALQGRASSAVRELFLDRDLIESVIALPAGITPSTDISLFAVVLDNQKVLERQGLIQVVDLRAQFEIRSKSRDVPRSLNASAARLLEDALASDRDGPVSRLVDRSHFWRSSHTVRSTLRPDLAEWTVEVPGDVDVGDFLRSRYAPAPVESIVAGDILTSIDPADVFPTEQQNLGTRLREYGWETTRLSALLREFPRPLEEGKHLPVSAEVHVFDQAPESGFTGAGLVAVVDPEQADADFLNSWLRSDLGKEAVRVARSAHGGAWRASLVRNTRSALSLLVDDLVVPIAPMAVQRSVAQAAADLSRAQQTLADASAELWASPADASTIRSRFAGLGEESLTGWSESLPFPVAAALWTVETKTGVDARRKQAMLAIEAYTTYFATVLLSASRQESASWVERIRDLQRLLTRTHLSMERPTFGTWVVISQRLSSLVRKRILAGDEEDLAQISGLFGGASIGALSRVLDPRALALLEEANSRRNAWEGHAGALTPAESASQLDQSLELLTSLRGVVGNAWQELPLVRGNRASKHGSTYINEVELLTGSRVPFVRAEYAYGEILESGSLFIGREGTASPLPLLPVFTLHHGPAEEISTGYFFNRLERDGTARLVSYQVSGASELSVPSTLLEAMSDVWRSAPES
jgi:type I restriction enzyme M protein